MKKYSKKYINHLKNKSKKGNSKRNKRKPNRVITLTNSQKKDKRRHRLKPKRLSAPKIFKLDYMNCEESISYVNLLKAISLRFNFIEIDLTNVDEIGEGAISMLLSVIEDLGTNTRIQGTYPSNSAAKEILERSGFFRYMTKSGAASSIDTRNTILTKGDYDTPPDEMAMEVRSAMNTVWGTEGRNPLLYGGIFEMIRNSCDHAFRKSSQVKWYLSITHLEDINKVKFSFVDNGKGIIRTLSIGPLKSFLNLFKDNADIINSAFMNGIESRTGLPWRGKGLPTIYELFKDNTVENLIVIANDTYLDFNSGKKMKLRKPYSGTYYYWEVTQNCEKYCFK